jgi:hypothetical protein
MLSGSPPGWKASHLAPGINPWHFRSLHPSKGFDLMRRLVSSRLAVVVAGVAAIACAKEKPAEQAAVPAPPPPPNVVHVEAADFSFKAPDTIPSGVTTFHLMNGGKEIHQVVLIKMPLAAVQKMDPNATPPADLVMAGGPNAAAPGGIAAATVDLAPGEYTMVCLIPSPDGKAHILKGMTRALTVTQGSSTAVLPAPDLTIKLTDYAFGVADTIPGGHHVIRIENDGPQTHEMVFFKLEPGKTAQDFLKWGEKLNGPPPGGPIDGASPMTVGQNNTVAVDLAPGNYVLVCFVGDTTDKKPHFLHGMVKTITVT